MTSVGWQVSHNILQFGTKDSWRIRHVTLLQSVLMYGIALVKDHVIDNKKSTCPHKSWGKYYLKHNREVMEHIICMDYKEHNGK